MPIFSFKNKICLKRVFQSKTEKVKKTEHWILHIQIGLGTKFQLKPTILVFLTKFAQKEYFQSKSEKMNTTRKFCIFKSVYILNFSLSWQFQFFWANLPNKVFSISNWKIEHHYWVLHIWISTGTKFPLKPTILIFWTKFTPKEYLAKIGKKWTTYKFCIFQISRNQISTARMKFTPKGYFQSKTEKVNSTTKFRIFKLVLVPNFS